MTAPNYSTNLTTLADFETAETVSTELTGYTATAKGEDQDTDFPIQGSQHASAEQRNASTGSLAVDNGSNITWTSGWSFFLWGMFLAPAAVNSDANAGIEMAIGSAITAFHRWTVGGNDFGRYPYGGWQNFVVNPEVSTGRTTTGAPGTNYRWVGMLCDVISAISKGSPYGIDVVRYGRGDIEVIYGETADYATFVGIASANDASTAKWGLFQEADGSYLWKGLLSLGITATAVDFRDSNRNIVIDNTRRVVSSFNRIEINHASSNIEWTNINITALGTVSKGEFEMIANAPVAMTTCVFTDMSTFILDSNADLLATTFRRCGQVTHGGATFDTCFFEGYEGTADTAYLVYNVNADIDGEIDDCEFTMGTALTHAIEFGTATPSTHTLRGLAFSGYHATSGNTSSALYFPDKGSDTSWTINLVGCSGDISYKKVRAGDTVTLVVDPVTTGITVKDLETGTLLEDARVLLWPTDNTNYFFEASITVTGSGTAATVAHTAHGMSTNDYVIMANVTDDAYNGTFQVTVTGDNAYTYTTVDTITSSSISGKVTFAFISGLTNSSGYISDTRSIASAQTILGRVRLSETIIDSKTVYLKQGVISGSISNTTGFSTTIQLVRDG